MMRSAAGRLSRVFERTAAHTLLSMAHATTRQLAGSFGRRLEFGDFLLLFYLAVFVRQYLWPAETWAAWALTVPLALAAWVVYVSTKGTESEAPGRAFWLVVAPPLVFVYLMRVAFPDTSFDVWTLRLFHAERALRGFLYWPGEFFPTSAPYNPAPDMLTGVFRHLLGYRLGTVVNLLALLWVGQLVDRLLRPRVSNAYARAACVLLVLFAEHLLFEINNYMVDLLALPLMLEATLLVLNSDGWKNERRSLARVAFLLGASVALKLTHVVMIVPLVIVCAWRALARRPFDVKRLTVTTVAAALAFFATLLPFMLYVYAETGSPVFPGYNDIFHSPFYPPRSGWDGRWGGLGPREILSWPLLMTFEPGRLSELGVYSGRISAGFVVAVGGGLMFRRRARFRTLCLIFITASLLWSLTMGYVRYALYLELLAGVLVVSFASLLAEKFAPQRPRLRLALVAPFVLVLVAQSALACLYVARTEWSLRPTVFTDFAGYVRESKHILRDRSLRALLPERERALFDGVEVWVVSGEKTAGLMPLLNRRAPFVNVRTPEYFITEAAREKYERALQRFDGRRMYSFALPGDFGAALFELRFRGLAPGRVERAEIPFYSTTTRVPVYFFEVTRADAATRAREPTRTRADGELPHDAYRAEISLPDAPATVKPGETLTHFFRVRNAGDALWPSLGGDRDDKRLMLRARWLDPRGTGNETYAGRGTHIFYDLAPGEEMPLPLTLAAPSRPGDYLLEAEMLHEGVGPFTNYGSRPFQLPVRVRP